MEATIKKSLQRIEQVFGVKIVFASESGSRAWGFSSKDSDYDCRFVYTRPLSWYLSIVERRDVIEVPIEGLLDINGWDLKKALYQIGKSNPVFYEWLISPISYMENVSLKSKLLDLAHSYFNPRTAIYHYLHMAIGNYKQYIVNCEKPKLKKYLYVLRPILACWYIRQKHSMPPITCKELFETAPEDVPLTCIVELLEKKRAGEELGEGKRIKALDKFIDCSLNTFSEVPTLPQRPKMELDDLNESFAMILLDWRNKC